MRNKSQPKYILFFIFLFILTYGVYKDSFHSYFFQDDWFSLRISSFSSIFDIWKFFIPRVDVIYYRPLGMQIPFYILHSLFNINPIPFRLLNYVTHILNIVLVYFLLLKITNKRIIGLLGSFSYATSTIHYIPFYWSATYAFVLGPTFSFLSILFFLHFLNSYTKKAFYFSFLCLIVALFTYEMAAVIPFLLLVYILLIHKKRREFLISFPHMFIAVIFTGTRLIFFPLPQTREYQISFGSYIIQNLKGYVLWSLNWPEEMKAQFINFHTINPQFIKDFPFYFAIFAVTLSIFIALFLIIPFILMLLKRCKVQFKYVIFGLSWFVIGLLPVLFFSKHSFAYYLSLSSIGLYIVLFTIFENSYKKKTSLLVYSTALVVFLFSWLVSVNTTIDFNSKVHWAPRRAKLSKTMIENSKSLFDNSMINEIYIDSSSENRLALNDQDAFIMLSKNIHFVTYYQRKP